jgi:Arrestin (or S-antigen), N-terminal domain
MSVRIILDNPSSFFTNLDFVTGTIVLVLTSDENVSAITVKLEGESKTMLLRPSAQYERHRHDDRNRLAHENHKILYRVQQVFPPQDYISGKVSNLAYTLPAGQHQYQFKLKIPFNNSCASQTQDINVPFAGYISLPAPGQLLYRHKTNTLPPSLTGFPNEAEIRYYVKVTVKRPSLLKENRRSQIGFKFLPIELPRPQPSAAEVYARRSHTFAEDLAAGLLNKGLLKRKPVPPLRTPPTVQVDARLPLLTGEKVSILTCNEPVPLRILVKKQNESPVHVFLSSLKITLTGYTDVRAQEVCRMETSTWVVTSQHDLSIPIYSPTDPVGMEKTIDSSLWDHIPLPPTVTPSFDTCNLTRTYTLEVGLGIGCGYPEQTYVIICLSINRHSIRHN